MDLPTRVKALGVHLKAALDSISELPQVARVRADGLVGAVDLAPDANQPDGTHGSRVARHAQELGLLYRVVGDTVALAPPMIITEAEIAEVARRLRSAIQAADAENRA